MTGQAQSEMTQKSENRYATCQDFLKVFDNDMPALYQLSFLLTGDHRKGERCFVSAMEDCARENDVFQEWAGSWAKRAIVQNAIRELRPRRGHSSSPRLLPPVFARKECSIQHFAVDIVLGLADFERFAFVLCVLEGYRERDCALLLGCSPSEVREARAQAIAQLVNCHLSGFVRYEESAVRERQRRPLSTGMTKVSAHSRLTRKENDGVCIHRIHEN